MRPTRAVPALFLLASLVVFVWLCSNYAEGHCVPTATFVMPPLIALALGGLVDPRILWAVGPRRRAFPVRVRVAGAIVFALGLVGSAVLLVWAPRSFG